MMSSTITTPPRPATTATTTTSSSSSSPANGSPPPLAVPANSRPPTSADSPSSFTAPGLTTHVAPPPVSSSSASSSPATSRVPAVIPNSGGSGRSTVSASISNHVRNAASSTRRGRRGSITYEASRVESKHFNAKELQNLAKQFNTWTNKQNMMDREGFRKSLGLLGMVQDALLCHQLFRVFNRSGTGQIDFEEYVTGLGVLMKGSLDEKLDFSFNMTDIDGSGEISFEELVLTVDSMTRIYAGIMGGQSSTVVLDKEKIRRVFAHLDRNHDGKISLDEYKNGMKRHPEFLNTLRGTELFRPLSGNSSSYRLANSKIDKLETALTSILQEVYRAEDALGALRDLKGSSRRNHDDDDADGDGQTANGEEELEEEEALRDITTALAKAKAIAEHYVPHSVRPPVPSKPVSAPTPPSLEEEEEKVEPTVVVDEWAAASEFDNEGNGLMVDDGLPPLPSTVPANKPRKGLIVYFGHKNWDLVVNVMKGIQMAVSRSAMEQDRPVSQYDFSVKEKYTLVSSLDVKNPLGGDHRTRFVDYAPFVFAKLREHFHIDHEEYMNSIGPGSMLSNLMLGSLSSLAEMGSEGKSGSFFYLSSDNRFLVKTVRKDEHKLLRHILPSYFRHMTKVGQQPDETAIDSMLTRIVGCHVVRSSKRSKTRTGAHKVYFVVMTNALETDLEVHRKYDLKGSWIGRKTSQAGREDPGKTLKDVDLTESTQDRIFVDAKMKQQLMATLRRDANFLEAHHIIDYSVLLGVHDHATVSQPAVSSPDLLMRTPSDNSVGSAKVIKTTASALSNSSLNNDLPVPPEHLPVFAQYHGGFKSPDGRQTYFMGIIDFLTQYGERKRLERFVKTIAHLNSSGLSVMPARAYAKRFLTFLDQRVIVAGLDRQEYFAAIVSPGNNQVSASAHPRLDAGQ